MSDFGRILIFTGITLILAGGIILVAVRLFPSIGDLPGDFTYESDNLNIYFPFATMLLISILGTIILNIVIRIFK